MGEILKNKTTFTLGDELSSYFALPTIEEPKEDYEKIKKQIYNHQDIEPEEKANIINKINFLKTQTTDFKKTKIKKEIKEFLEKYHI